MHSQSGQNPDKNTNNDSVAQLVEQMTLNHWVVSSSLTGVTTRKGKMPQIAETKIVSAIFVYIPARQNCEYFEVVGCAIREQALP